MRADARRNRERILETAREAFATEGLTVSLDEIARRAGVGPGTVHRHFPAKEALIEAVLTEHLASLTEQARQAVQSDRDGSAFFPFLHSLISEAHGKQDLADALAQAGVKLSERTQETALDLRQAFADLLVRAQDAGAVRTDVDAEDVQAIVLGALTAERHHPAPDRPGRMAAVVLDCLLPAREERPRD
ncbi:helix-turn-helix domain-containing protein [Nonomuraea sp. NPDC049784]|uniref:helix-turn-helix domain-containing protein n=1 Tax=Nonomuraea sp. NPDC049784 TaxID=3154361 RepID=UPI0033E2B4CE